MSAGYDPTYINDRLFLRVYGYRHTEVNKYDEYPEANAAMQVRIRRSPRFDPQIGLPFPCECAKRGNSGVRCKLGSCETHNAGFECPASCVASFPSRPCSNRNITTEDFNEAFDIRVHRDPSKGRGLFAIADIKANTYLGEVKGVLRIADNDNNHHLPNAFCFEIGKDFQSVGERSLFLDLKQIGNEFRFINTCCTPNAELITKAIGQEFHLGVRTIKKIYENEEITVTYSDSMLNFIERHVCGKKKCLIKENLGRRRQREDGLNNARQSLIRREKSGARENANNVRQDLLDRFSCLTYFDYPGVGPIKNTGFVRSGTRQLRPFHLISSEVSIFERRCIDVNNEVVNNSQEGTTPADDNYRIDPRAGISEIFGALSPIRFNEEDEEDNQNDVENEAIRLRNTTNNHNSNFPVVAANNIGINDENIRDEVELIDLVSSDDDENTEDNNDEEARVENEEDVGQEDGNNEDEHERNVGEGEEGQHEPERGADEEDPEHNAGVIVGVVNDDYYYEALVYLFDD